MDRKTTTGGSIVKQAIFSCFQPKCMWLGQSEDYIEQSLSPGTIRVGQVEMGGKK